MKISQVMPGVTERRHPVVRPEYPLLVVLYLLRMKDIDAVPLRLEEDRPSRAVFGFSSLASLVALGPRRFAKKLDGPCVLASNSIPLLSAGDELDSLLSAFASRRLGFALVHEPGWSKEPSLVSVRDCLGLYRDGAISTRLRVEDVGTPLVSVTERTSLKVALRAMFKHRHRRVFIGDSRTYVSDRDMLDHLFTPDVLETLSSSRKDPLASPVGKLRRSTPGRVTQTATLAEAAAKLESDPGGCLLTTGDRVVSPWDVIVKPWSKGELSLA